MKFSWKIFFITFLIIITSFGAGGFLLINTVFTNTLNNRIDSAKKNNNYITTALSVYADNNLPTYGNLEYLRVSAIGFAKQIAGNSDSKIKIGSINELSFSAENEFAHGMSVNSRKSRVVTENKKYYIQTISKIQLVTKSCYIETVDNITSVYSDRDMYCTIYQFILIGVALFASILLVIFSKLLTRPLVKLKDASKEVAKGNFNMRVKESHGITSSTEITELSQSFNTMADYVEDYIEQLKLATQNRDNFIADFTHELKTPLTSVIGYADMLRSYEMEPKQRRECADLIYKEGSRLEALSLNLLNLIVLKNDEIKTVNIKTDIIADDIKKSVLFILKKYGVKLKLNVEKAEVNAEPSLLKTLLYNLIDNACKASESGKPVTLTGYVDSDRYRFCVTDSGCGIAEDDLAKITEPFYMVDKSRSRSMGGAGLGLSICNEIAKLHGSTLEIVSEVGKGTDISFTVSLADNSEEVRILKMKFNLKKSAKYIICTLLTLTVVATVVFLPRFYYSVTDNRDSVGNTAETFKLTADITTLSGGEFLKLVSSEDTVWVLQNNAPKAETVISYAKKAISNLANSLKDTNLFSNIAGYIPQFFTFDSCSGYKLTMRGTLDGNVIVSSDIMFVACNYAKEGARYGLNITMLFDTETFTIYELNIDTTYLSDSGTESENPLYSVIPYSDSYEQELSDALIKYWGVSSDSITVNVSPESFSINICPQPFLEYSKINNEQFDYYVL